MRITAMVLLLALVNLACAQMEEVVVTGSRINGDDYSRMPAITVTKQADFLIRSIKLSSDTRLEAGRTDELYQSIKDLLASASKRPEFSLAYGEEFLIPIAADEYTRSTVNKSVPSGASELNFIAVM
jgi:hypothetical protein